MLLGSGIVRPHYVLYSVALTILTLAAGLIFFEKAEKSLIDAV
jgi:ABC-type polysaccharide/polyol phosphate export permease